MSDYSDPPYGSPPPPGGAPPPGAPPPPGGGGSYPGAPPHGGAPEDPYRDGWHQPYAAYAPQGQTPGMAVASLILGIVSLPTCMCYGCPSLICGVLGVVFGVMVLGQIKRDEAPASAKGICIAGIVCGGVGILLSAMFWVFAVLGAVLDGM